MKTSGDLKQFLRSIDGKGYPAYKGAKGEYQFPGYVLSIDHIQGDPFAAPSRISIQIQGKKAAFPVDTYDLKHKRIALSDELLRRFGKMLEPYSFQAKGSGKSGLLSISRPGQEILERIACQVNGFDGSLTLRLEAGFPANGRSIRSEELIKILFDFLPACISKVCFYDAYTQEEKSGITSVIELSKDQEALRCKLSDLGLIAFVANGAILPRQSGISNRPMAKAVPFQSPSSMEVEIVLPHRGAIKGMGIPKGVTLIVGGGYHGKSTLLEALEKGVYPHIAGDGREFVITDSSAVKLRAEDGRSVRKVDISGFINHLPNGRDTSRFSTEDASGSTSQAASMVEAMEAGAHVFLIDEDTSATNFMIRDRLMQQVVKRSQEPITPFIERIRGLYETKGISTILVAGSSGAYFHVADHVIQMDSYVPREITKEAKEAAKSFGEAMQSLEFPLINLSRTPSRLEMGGDGKRSKTKVLGRDSLKLDSETVDLRYVEQIADIEQIAALGYLIQYAGAHLIDGKKTLAQIVDELEKRMELQDLNVLGEKNHPPGNLAVPRRQEMFAAFNRCRSLRF
ncbi:ABC-ATPase domain-containing protein [Lacrimispora xylanolytica]|uniref:ABC-ATPase domain-containing protein n=1 Tax=Lacrimispora xylanolytica TaxID=29375 RepID=A0ABY7ADK7_9FIRM|nr:ABC-ATPase domain-containing protein [Lacrimispora xylanolytica]WAJ24802.1 ABC-ATPase domain-containing protein [Lacrimispora xylanolytica]